MKETFEHHKFGKATLARIAMANGILEDLARQGYSISLRQLYYQLVSKGEIPNNNKEYKKLGDTLNKARLAGLVDWHSLEDRGRRLRGSHGGYESQQDYINGLENGYFRDWWEGQENYVEVWIEKDALVNVIERPCDRHRVRYFSCRGYSSASEQYRAGKRFQEMDSAGRVCHILHLGDHDPSGLDMTRDNQDKAVMFSGVEVNVHRLALNMDQVDELNPPPNPAKLTDSRVGEYMRLYGRQSWELDALPPSYIDNLVDVRLRELIDVDQMDAVKAREQDESDDISRVFMAVGGNYDDVKDLLSAHGYL